MGGSSFEVQCVVGRALLVNADPQQRAERQAPVEPSVRRFYPMGMFNSALGIAARTAGPTYAALYEGKWRHPNP